jgi:hypothetical protein
MARKTLAKPKTVRSIKKQEKIAGGDAQGRKMTAIVVAATAVVLVLLYFSFKSVMQ